MNRAPLRSFKRASVSPFTPLPGDSSGRATSIEEGVQVLISPADQIQANDLNLVEVRMSDHQ